MKHEMYSKRIVCFIALTLVFALALTACGGKSGQGKNNTDIAKGDGWVIKQDGTLVVSGENSSTPALDIDAADDSAWASYKSQIKTVVVEEGVTSIGPFAFACVEYLESVSLPDSLTVIGASAFADSMRLQKVDIPNGVTDIREMAFMCCRGLTEVEIPAGVEKIGFAAFASCDMVQKVTLHEGLKDIGDNAFGFTTLKAMALPEGVETIGDSAFSACRDMEELTLPASLTKVGENVFPPAVKKINYGGTKEDWVKLVGSGFVSESAVVEIACSDGVIRLQFAETEESTQEESVQEESLQG